MVTWPSETQALALQELDHVRVFVGLSNAAVRAITARVGDLNNRYQHFASITAPTLLQSMNTARVIVTAYQAADPSTGAAEVQEVSRRLEPLETAQVGAMWRISRRLVMLSNGTPWADTLSFDVDPSAPPPPQPQFPPLPPGWAIAQQQPQAPSAPKHKFSTYLDQTDETEFQEADATTLRGWNANFIADAQVKPPRQERASPLQLAAMHHKVVTLGRSPYANFATLLPYEERVSRRNKFSVPYVVHGEYRVKEQPGPASFTEWIGCFRIFKTIMRSLGQCTGSALIAYEQKIEQLNRDYPECWGLIYAAEDTMRAEELPLILERIHDLLAAQPQALPRLWNPNAPWSAVILSASEGGVVGDIAGAPKDYWEEHVIIPANRWLARGCPGAAESSAPDLQLARSLLPGGQGRSLGPGGGASDRRVRSPKRERSSSTQGGGRGRGKKRRAPKKTKGQKKRRETDRAEKDAARQANQYTSKEKGTGKGKSKGEQICFGFSKGYGPCASASPGSACKEGRKHACHVCGGNHSAKTKGCKPKGPG